MIDEAAKRRDDFDPMSIPVDFGPGRGEWLIPPPRITFRRGHDEKGRSQVRAARTFGPDFDKLVDRVAASTDLIDMVEAAMDLAADLLLRNYDLTQDEMDSLLEFTPSAPGPDGEAPEVPEPWYSIWRVAQGLPPKASAPTSSPAS